MALAVMAALVWTVAAGAQAPAAGAPGADALWEAARRGDASGVTRALDAGVDVNTPFRYGATALSYACDRGHLEVVKILLARGARVDVADTFYKATPLNWASSPAQARKPEHAEIVGLLLKHGAKGIEGALSAAVGEGDVPMVKVILAAGGLPATALSDALEAAQKEKNAALVAALEAGGARPYPVVALTEAQLARYAGAYSAGQTEIVLAVKDGRLEGGPPGQTLTLVPRSETVFGVPGAGGLTISFTVEGERATILTLNQRSGPVVYKRVEGK
jgi:Ankyrin repeats (3 copies)